MRPTDLQYRVDTPNSGRAPSEMMETIATLLNQSRAATAAHWLDARSKPQTTPMPHHASVATHMPHLDGLRCFALFIVLWQHAGPGMNHRFGNLGIGVYGVRLFFVLSAFLITGILLRVRDGYAATGSALGAFYARRFLRIFPAYYGLLAVLVLFGLPMAKGDLTAHFLYLSNWRIIQHGDWPEALGHFWSLAVEEQFYLVWPLLIFLVPPKRLPWVFVGAAAMAVLSRATILFMGGKAIAVELPTVSNLDSLAAGALLAWHSHTYPHAVADRRRVLDRGLVVGCCLLILTLGLSVYGRGLRVFGIEESVSAALIGVWLVDRCARGVTGIPQLVLEWRPIAYIGTISYGVYLFHSPILWALRLTPGSETLFEGSLFFLILVTAMSVGVAALSWRFFESPINGLKRHFAYPTHTTQNRK